MTPDEFESDPAIMVVRSTEFGRWLIDRCRLDGDCWRWLGSVNNYGYPQINTGRFGRGQPVRMLVEQQRGDPLNRSRERLRNTCGMRACCNPAHWQVVPPGRVIAEQYRQGLRGSPARLYASAIKAHAHRAASVGSHARAAEARALRAAGRTSREIAAHFGISVTTAKRWASGQAWRESSPFRV